MSAALSEMGDYAPRLPNAHAVKSEGEWFDMGCDRAVVTIWEASPGVWWMNLATPEGSQRTNDRSRTLRAGPFASGDVARNALETRYPRPGSLTILPRSATKAEKRALLLAVEREPLRVLGSDLQRGDVISVWWKPHKVQIASLVPYIGALSKLWKGRAKIAAFHIGPGMTIEPDSTYEVWNRDRDDN